ncbi:hypothetical protein I316_02330 [Kwoniella heveanensis BCC8398]|uniref:Uncharacterized protein n=1 Tax=Kwoniella heveanensis BCC8398 TaxID=1296120 RepID=A0A1B9GXS6_9TREE|nr:hypothetical protein I316_02330 [Kwoniella heveanensis BCC8398]
MEAPTTDSRTTPRPLTRRELQACWVEMPADPGEREEYVESTGVDEVLPQSALNQGIDELSVPTTYPAFRTSYDRLPSKTLLIAQSTRTFKLSVIRDAVLTCGNGWRYPDDGTDVFQRLLSDRRVSEEKVDRVPLPNFERVYGTAQELKDRANASYTSGEWLDALGVYGRAWMTMFPYHIFAFPKGDRRAFLLGELDTTIFNNLTATCLDTYRKSQSHSKSQSGSHKHKLGDAMAFKLLSMGFNSGMAAANSHHADMMTVGAAQKLSRRLLEIHEYLQSPANRAYGHPGLPSYMVDHHKYVLEHLKDKPPKALLYDAAPELKQRIESLDR